MMYHIVLFSEMAEARRPGSDDDLRRGRQHGPPGRLQGLPQQPARLQPGHQGQGGGAVEEASSREFHPRTLQFNLVSYL